ncbi:MAG: hypothetical protein O6943_10595 [Bacteroidetes bacterium]|nr:hypothetical protein [Bacteroidota bacterium]
MMKYLVVFALVFCFISAGFSQESLSDYSFVVVPEKYDFVNEIDKYQLNSLTKFLFNKHGFNAYFDREMPDIRRCDGLWAKVEGRPAMIRTKVVIILNDCKGKEIFRSEVGTSKLKQYSKTYTAALRNAFLSIEELGVQQKEPIIFITDETKAQVKDDSPSEVLKEVTPKTEVTKSVPIETVITPLVLSGSAALFTNNGANFVLEENMNGYTLYQKIETGEKVKGTLVRKNNETYQFVDTSGNTFNCYFDSEKNLIIETSFQKMIFEAVRQ